jgi:hypothetical protein
MRGRSVTGRAVTFGIMLLVAALFRRRPARPRDAEPTTRPEIGREYDTKIVNWRIECLLAKGFGELHAVALATADDQFAWRLALDLVRDGCSHETAIRVAL